MTVISYPTPLYSNPEIRSLYYVPSRFVISEITRGGFTIITTSSANNYVAGQKIRLLIPEGYGSRQLSGVEGYISVILSSTMFIWDVDSSKADAFIAAPVGYTNASPQVIAIGDITSGQINTTPSNSTNYISGSFRNISPLESAVAAPISVTVDAQADSGSAVSENNVMNFITSDGNISTSGVDNTITIFVTPEISKNYASITSASSPYTVLDTNYYLSCDSSGGAISLLLPDSTSLYRKFIIKDKTNSAAANPLTVTTVSGTVTIDTVTTYTLNAGYGSVKLIYNGLSYEIF